MDSSSTVARESKEPSAMDPEIAAMSAVNDALRDLEPVTQARVIDWASKRFNPLGVQVNAMARARVELPTDKDHFADFAELFDAVDPKTDSERALTAGYWFQVIKGQPALRAQELNDALKELGHRLSNVTDALTGLQNRRPTLLRQISKSGRTRQARKTYRLTREGIVAIERMIRGDGEAAESVDRSQDDLDESAT